MKTLQIIAGMLAGVAGGIAMGILFAPNKGSKTQSQILEKGEEYAEALRERFDKIVTPDIKKMDIFPEELDGKASSAKKDYYGSKK